ncbi:MAG: hypothetical protein F6K19_08070 [Cyanothece sp. SIO1E1]|nr:hypothetical protein [Cyanothece sp. SIO1E1]
MKHALLLSFLFLCHCLNLSGQNGIAASVGARSAGMGYTGLTYKNIHSAFTNQAGLAHLKEFGAFASGEQRFLVSELQALGAAFAYPTSSGTFALTVNNFGFEGYSEQRFGLGYGRKLFDKLSIGGQILVFNTSIPEYGSRAAISFELGMLATLSREVDIAFQLFNPVRIEWVEGENLPSVLKVGMAYHPSPILDLIIEVEKDIDQVARGKFGLEYKVASQVDIRLGATTGPTLMTMGVGYQIAEKIMLNISSSYHQVLGFTPGAGIVYEYREKQKKNESTPRGSNFF